ncbi:MAG: SBBP repeat-containing protein [Bacteroidota bacterium]
MKKLFFLLVLTLICGKFILAQENAIMQWVKQIGGTYSDDRGYSLTLDASGNVYTTGFFGTADFDPGADTFNLTSVGGDIFISKIDSSGNFVWAEQMGGSDFDYGTSIAVDASGNVYTTGLFRGAADFDPGADTFKLTSAGVEDIFISKLNSSGNFIWAKQIDGTNLNYGPCIAIDTFGNVYTTGPFHDTADFDPGAGVYNLRLFSNIG